MGIFKPCDIRGIYNQDLTEEVAYNLGRALATICPQRKAVIGGDVRLSTPALKDALSLGLIAAGSQVLDLGIVSTPVFYFAVKTSKSPIGVMVTASHNPPEYNGFKLLMENKPPQEEDLHNLEQIMTGKNFHQGQGSYQKDGTWIQQYKNYLTQHFKPGDLKIVLDCGNGSNSLLAPQLFRSLGYEIVELYCTPDGDFPTVPLIPL